MHYFFQGLGLLSTKGLRRFVLIPLTINLLLFAVAFFFLLQQVQGWVDYLMGFVPEFLSFLSYVIWPLLVLSTVLTLAFSFTMVANFIAAPFNALLSEKVEQHLTGQALPDQGFAAFLKDVPRMLAREWTKFVYCFPRALVFLLAFFFIPLVGQLMWFLFTAWMMAIQYCDYAYDNHKVPFDTMRQQLRADLSGSYGFGMTVAVASMVPFLNLLVMPVAVCGATALWVDRFKSSHYPR
ncbi:sulfate transporter CysZ [Rheinheimera sp. 4Y26]|uniref:sulfate transporter CysZ n=1 Tax=Rheinheimera sp. 4Y26 TaxID=2977811 RepID=UPI0021B0FE3E|nr:sulfate transporter CysZ [Rheinheimera sp. 4Y26]MCT6701363.1 sulfate transporter CysZ [Rheinheimera sp. 4Y26]